MSVVVEKHAYFTKNTTRSNAIVLKLVSPEIRSLKTRENRLRQYQREPPQVAINNLQQRLPQLKFQSGYAIITGPLELDAAVMRACQAALNSANPFSLVSQPPAALSSICNPYCARHSTPISSPEIAKQQTSSHNRNCRLHSNRFIGQRLNSDSFFFLFSVCSTPSMVLKSAAYILNIWNVYSHTNYPYISSKLIFKKQLSN